MRHLAHSHLSFEGALIAVWLVALAAGIACAWLCYRRTNPPIPSSLRTTLLGLRGLSLAVVILLLTQPVVVLAYRWAHKPVMAVLIDTSKSMTVVDGSGSRAEVLRDVFRPALWDSVRERCTVRLFEFAEETRALPGLLPDSLVFVGRGTDIANALNRAAEALGDRHLAGFILLTDGASNLGKDPVRAAKALQRPVYAVGIGDPHEPRDIKIHRTRADAIAFAGDSLQVNIEVTSSGFEDLPVPVVVTAEGKELARGTVRLTSEAKSGSGSVQTLALHVVPDHPGLHRYEAYISLQEGELAAENNRQMFFVNVLKKHTAALLVAGGPSADFAFLKRSLERDKNLTLDTLIPTKGGQFYEGAFPQDLSKYDLVILLDLPREPISGKPERDLAEFVQNGKAVLILGGPHALGAEFGDSPLAQALPVSISTDQSSYRKGSFHLELTKDGLVHPATRLADGLPSSAHLWAELPPLLALNQNEGARKEATVLAVHPTFTHQGRKVPLIAVGRYGRGKVLVCAFSSFWRMDLMMWGIAQAGNLSDRFWQNAVRWLATVEESSPVQIATDKRAYRGGERVCFEGEVYDERFWPQQHAEVAVTITGPNTTTTVRADHVAEGRYRAELSELPAGDYTYTCVASLDGRPIGESNGTFSVDRYSLEFGRVALDEALLSRIARESGGKYYRPNEAATLPEDLDLPSAVLETSREIPLWSSPWVFMSLLLSLAVEWAVRRRRGMV